jgi:hypothetical protein
VSGYLWFTFDRFSFLRSLRLCLSAETVIPHSADIRIAMDVHRDRVPERNGRDGRSTAGRLRRGRGRRRLPCGQSFHCVGNQRAARFAPGRPFGRPRLGRSTSFSKSWSANETSLTTWMCPGLCARPMSCFHAHSIHQSLSNQKESFAIAIPQFDLSGRSAHPK